MTDQPPTLGAVAETLPPLTPWQQQIADAILRGGPITLSIPRGNGRATIARHIEASEPAHQPRTALELTSRACPAGCCVAVVDPTLGIGSDYSRPMFEVLPDRATYADPDDFGPDDGMRIDASEYDRPDRIFL